MQYNTLHFILILIPIFLCNCNLKKADSNISNIETTNITSRKDSVEKIENSIFPIYIDKDNDYQEKRITCLQDIGNVEYIKLETNDSCLIRASYKLIGIFLTDKDIFLSTGDNVLRFNRKGKYINTIGKEGQGPWEIVGLQDFYVDDIKKEVYLLDGATQNLKTYEYGGQFKNTTQLEIYGDDIGAIENNNIIYTTFLANNRPMAIQSSLKDGKVIKEILPARTEKDVTGLSIKFWDKFTDNLIYNNKVIYQNFINDTIYTIDIKNHNASPRYIQLPPNTGLDGNNTSPFISFETDRYAYIIICKRPPMDHNFVIDKKENKIYKGFIADLNRNTAIKPINTNIDNVISDLYDAFTLQDFLEKGYLKGKLKEIAETLKDDDNPVLMIATINF